MGRIQRAVIVVGCAFAIVAIGILDWWTGLEARVFPLYFVPIAIGVQAGGRAPRYLLAVLATVVWRVAYDLAGGGMAHLSSCGTSWPSSRPSPSWRTWSAGSGTTGSAWRPCPVRTT